MWWEDLLGAPPRGDQQATFLRLVGDLRGRHGFSVEAMLHDLVLTEAYGAP
jgi:ABC-type hemin transport system ATPase subunit